MIKNKKKLANYLSSWIKKQAEEAGAKALVVGISGGVDSALVAALCARTGMRTIGVKMPCQSSPSSKTRGDEVIKKFNLVGVNVNLTEAYYSIQLQVELDLNHEKSNATEGALRSCLRAPTLDYVGKATNGIIVGTGNRDEDEVTRYFQKRGDGCVDISPIAKLHKSEVFELSRYLGVPKSVLKAKPSADLWGPDSGQEDEKELGMTYADIERGIRAAEAAYDKDLNSRANSYSLHSGIFLSGIYGGSYEKPRVTSKTVTNDDLLNAAKHATVDADKALFARLASMEASSKHKTKLPICDPRNEAGLFE